MRVHCNHTSPFMGGEGGGSRKVRVKGAIRTGTDAEVMILLAGVHKHKNTASLWQFEKKKWILHYSLQKNALLLTP